MMKPGDLIIVDDCLFLQKVHSKVGGLPNFDFPAQIGIYVSECDDGYINVYVAGQPISIGLHEWYSYNHDYDEIED